jgi:hypothetical protein
MDVPLQSSYITPLSKAWRHDLQEVARSALVKGIESKVATLICQAVPGYHWPDMDLSIYLPAVIACIIALSLDEVLEVVVPHAAIKDLLNLILLIAINNYGWW